MVSVRGKLITEIEELLEKDPVSRNMLHRGEWKNLSAEDLIKLKATIEEAIKIVAEITGKENGSTRAEES